MSELLPFNIDQDAQIVAELARLFPKEPLSSIVHVLDMPTLQQNAAMWRAQELSFIEKHDGDMSKPLVAAADNIIYRSDEVMGLRNTVLYVMREVAKSGQDLSEDQINMWMQGIKAHWIAIALRQLMEERKIVTYAVINHTVTGKGRKAKSVDDTYVFYSLPENVEQRWGLKQFPDKERIELADEAQSED